MDPNHVLHFLRQSTPPPEQNVLACEFRLICSGQLYAGPNPWQNILSRVLLKEPFGLFVALPHMVDISMSYPQELALRIGVQRVDEQKGSVSIQGYPIWDIAFDLAALLTLLCRRLITVAGLASVKNDSPSPQLPPWLRELPAPLVTAMDLKHWPQQPSVYINHPTKPELNHYQPLIRKFETDRISGILKRLPSIEHAERVVLAARLYWSAMAALYERPDIAYLLVTMSVEALANQAVTKQEAKDDAKKSVPRRVRKKWEALGLTEDQVAGAWAEVAPAGSTYKFGRFMADNVTDQLWEADDLFCTNSFLEPLLPTKATLGDALRTIYDQRNLFVHHGKPYPQMIGIGIGPLQSSEASADVLAGVRFPPLVWFERAVHLALVNYIEKQLLKIDK